jgi:tetratricopeptide (TPR) repeat protein
LKEKANEAFRQQKFYDALNFYNKALDLLPQDEFNEKAILLNNKGLCFQKLKDNLMAKK